ncbi:hypothetical protein GYMLUDRAFT_59713 [Collybiopsis luxurians FD-317 M1]|uniref:SAM domain-containing protein n=1 Tax=Collybiopsis luxurians FD-317 M1 TaxID=944289 RepID=A0A0D0B9E8_9AGAR|nr:hypothetical protein GYMLUDRAFT_59713 [Collybiopsis luxurians FD-317 M1]
MYLTTYTLTKPKAKKSVAVLKKDAGSAKTKSSRFIFAGNEENYLSFMNAILLKMGLAKFKATKTKVFCMKMAIPLKKKAQACNVESLVEYVIQVEKIIESKSSSITVYIDQKEVSELCGKSKSKSGGSDDDGEDYDEDNGSMSAMERELARIRGILEKEYGNDYDMTYTWIDPETGNKVPLSLLAMDKWTRAIYSGFANKFRPPSNPDSKNFSAENRQSSIQPFGPLCSSSSCRTSSEPAAMGPGAKSDIAHLANIMLIITNPKPPSAPEFLALPDVSSTIKNTSTKLCHFLEHAETNLGVVGASHHLYAMETKGYGPDILDCIDDGALMDLGIKHGDAMHLKQAAPVWWSGPEASSKRSAFVSGPASASTSATAAAAELHPN